MKINLIHIAEIIYDVTGITLKQMQSKQKFPEFAEARYLFILIALKHGDYTKNYQITDFINSNKSIINYALKNQYRKDIINTIRLIEPILKEHSNNNIHNITMMLDQVNNTDKISLVNNIISKIPKHQKALITL